MCRSQRQYSSRCLSDSVIVLLMLCVVGGCSSSKKEPAVVEAPKEQPNVEAKPPAVEAPNYQALWTEQLAVAQRLLEQDDVDIDDVQREIAKLNELAIKLDDPTLASTNDPTSIDHRQQLSDLKQLVSAVKATREEAFRQEQLSAAQQFMNRGKFVEATQAINLVLARLPTNEQRERAGGLAADIERRRRAKRDLQSWMQLLESTDRREIATARTQLSRDVDTAVSLLVEATEQLDKPILVRNALEVLRTLNRPDVSVPAMLAVLERSEQSENWPDVIEQLGKFTVPGAGQALLNMTLSATEPEKRVALISGLSRVVDPPKSTLAALLPAIYADGVELTVALQAVQHAAIVHQQFDFVSRRGIDFELTVDQQQMLTDLPERLTKIAASDTPEAASAAKIVSATFRFTEPKAFEGVKVARAHAESENGLAIAVLDGVWNSTEPETMWRHPVDKQSLIELDLGESKVVTGVKIWNLNEPSYAYRGWKDVHIYVGDSVAKMRLAAKGLVPQAPGGADVPDYSTIVPIDFVKGRFVRLVGKSTWSPNTHTGITEVQVLGL